MKTKLIILGLGVIILGGLGLWITKKPIQNDISIKDWKTYKDSSLGFEFKYPVTQTIQEKVAVGLQKEFGYNLSIEPIDAAINIRKTGYSSEDDGIGYSPSITIRQESFKIGNVEAQKFVMDFNSQGQIEGTDGIADFIQYKFSNNDLNVVIYLSNPSEEKDFDKILSTFKFTKVQPVQNQTNTDEITNWKTYENVSGYTVRFPSDYRIGAACRGDLPESECQVKNDSIVTISKKDYVSITISPGISTVNKIDDWIAQQQRLNKVLTIKKLKLDNHNAAEIVIDGIIKPGTFGTTNEQLYVKLIGVEMNNQPVLLIDQAGQDLILDQIISTIRFTK